MHGLSLTLAQNVIRNLSNFKKFSFTDNEALYLDAIFSNDGRKMFTTVNDKKRRNGKIMEYDCNDVFNSRTAKFIREIDLNNPIFLPAGGASTINSLAKISFNNDGSKLFVLSHQKAKTSTAVGWARNRTYYESFLYEIDLGVNFSLETINACTPVCLYANRYVNGDVNEVNNETLLGYVDGSTVNQNTYRIVTGFDFQENGNKLFLSCLRGHVAVADSEINNDRTYFGDICVLPLPTAFVIGSIPLQTNYTGFDSTNNMIVRENSTINAKDIGFIPLDIVLHDSGKTMSILTLSTTSYQSSVMHFSLTTPNDIYTAIYDSISIMKDVNLSVSLHNNNYVANGNQYKNL